MLQTSLDSMRSEDFENDMDVAEGSSQAADSLSDVKLCDGCMGDDAKVELFLLDQAGERVRTLECYRCAAGKMLRMHSHCALDTQRQAIRLLALGPPEEHDVALAVAAEERDAVCGNCGLFLASLVFPVIDNHDAISSLCCWDCACVTFLACEHGRATPSRQMCRV
jgi:protein-arginine kinase activator protein McsA